MIREDGDRNGKWKNWLPLKKVIATETKLINFNGNKPHDKWGGQLLSD